MASERVDVELHRVGGVVRSHPITRTVARYCQQSDHLQLVARLRESCTGRDSAASIAERHNGEGFRPPKRVKRFTGETVRRLRHRLDGRPRTGCGRGPGRRRQPGHGKALAAGRLAERAAGRGRA